MTLSASPIWAILPIKSLDGAKQRLRKVLSPNERRELMLNSARDVLTALSHSSHLSGILLVSKDEDAIALGTEFDVSVLRIESDNGQSDAIDKAVFYLQGIGVTSTLSIPGDAPLLLAVDIDIICDTLKNKPSITIVSNADGTGSNCIGTSSAGLISYQFGTNSFAKHVASAREHGIQPTLLSLPRLELDIDTPGDISQLMEHPARTRTQEFVANSGLQDRLFTTAHTALPRVNFLVENEIASG